MAAFIWPPLPARPRRAGKRHDWQGGIVCQRCGLERRNILRERNHNGFTACLLVEVWEFKIKGEWVEVARVPACDLAARRREAFTVLDGARGRRDVE